jgi:hypothetical protein
VKGTKLKTLAVFALSAVFALLYFKFTKDLPYLLRLMFKLPEVLLILWLLANWVGKKKQGIKTWRFKSWWIHYPVMILGFIEIIWMFSLSRAMGIPQTMEQHPTAMVTDTASSFSGMPWPAYVMLALFCIAITVLPLYGLMNFLFMTFRLNQWAYATDKRLVILVLILDDLVFSGLFSILR